MNVGEYRQLFTLLDRLYDEMFDIAPEAAIIAEALEIVDAELREAEREESASHAHSS